MELAEGEPQEEALEQEEERPQQLGQAEVRVVPLPLSLVEPAELAAALAVAVAAEPVAAPEAAEAAEAEAGAEEAVGGHLPPYL